MKWNPQAICAVVIVFTICLIFIMAEWGILQRSEHGDVEASRNLLDGNIKLLIGLLGGFLIGKTIKQEETKL